MTLSEVMMELQTKGSEGTKRVLAKHGAKEPFFGVKVADLKVILKKIKGDQALALQLFASGNSDAQYLAGLAADGRKMSERELQRWVETAAWSMISEYSVAWVASEHPSALELARRWVDSPKESVASSGWTTLSALAAVMPDDKLPIQAWSALLDRIVREIGSAPDRVRYTMNGFVIACGTYVAPLAERALAAARTIGEVTIDMGETECHVPVAEGYITKARRGAAVAPKRKSVRC